MERCYVVVIISFLHPNNVSWRISPIEKSKFLIIASLTPKIFEVYGEFLRCEVT
jgi:hypothetical protein